VFIDLWHCPSPGRPAPSQGTANAFYAQRVAEHLRIGLEALRALQASGGRGARRLHSRKLRGFDEPPFR
jgi:AMP nucleosidase